MAPRRRIKANRHPEVRIIRDSDDGAAIEHRQHMKSTDSDRDAGGMAGASYAASSLLALINDSAGMPSPSCKRRTIARVSGRLRESTS